MRPRLRRVQYPTKQLKRLDDQRAKRLNVDELHRIAKKLRVQRVMQPYLETVVL